MRLKEKYQKQIVPKMKEKFGYKNGMEVPRIIKATINVGVGRNSKDHKYVDEVVKSIIQISGQKPVQTKAKKSIASFKLRQGTITGVMATLRGRRMYDFLEKLVNISFPRVRDFRGISASQVDRTGNLTVGFKENIVFPEISQDEVENIHGLEISVTTNAKTREEGLELLKLIGFPFKEEEKKG
ncbi:MAG: 50S ribosomal protein L5 [Patescibacteria group bacterium]|jgi:large subunit ribosomal protein L5